MGKRKKGLQYTGFRDLIEFKAIYRNRTRGSPSLEKERDGERDRERERISVNGVSSFSGMHRSGGRGKEEGQEDNGVLGFS